jgi:type II secretory pathway component GspD/PulD (secretin)
MKSLITTLVSSSVLGLFLTTAAQTNPPPNPASPKPSEPATAPADQAAPPPGKDATASPASNPATTEAPAPAETAKASAPEPKLNPDELLLNFRNAPLEAVLDYLSKAAGFIIAPRTGGELKGKVTVWSEQPVTKEEALELLYAQLDQNGYTAVRNGRTLTIFNKEDAKKQDLPVKISSKPSDIPKTDEMVTQIIPLHYISAVQVSRDLQPLLPDRATMTANEGGNSIIITDTQTSIHRMAEIISALDTAISSVSAVRVFPLKFADSKAVASVIKDLFAPQETSNTGRGAAGGGGGRFFNQFRGGGGGGFGGNRGGGNTGGDSTGGRAPTPKVVAVAEERSNSVVVSAPDDQMPIIADLIEQVDTNVEDITELRVFHLKFADAQETADLLTSLFSTQNSANNNNNQGFRGAIRFAGRFGGPFGMGANNATPADQSSRSQKQTQVIAVPDLRTGSVVVSASRDLMKQIGDMIHDLDADPAKKQQVYVFDFQNTDPSQAVNILSSLFPNTASGANSNLRNMQNQAGTGNQLNMRATQNQNTFNRVGSSGGLGGGMGGGLGSGSLGR